MSLYSLLKPLLFLKDSEAAHHWAFDAMGFGGGVLLSPFALNKEEQTLGGVDIAGLHFKNRVGLAAGFDKNALRLKAWEKLGFSHVEVGTITPKAQLGNAKPRLFRLVKDEALINRMGFNNDGSAAIATRLQQRPSTLDLIIGGNIGKNKETPEDDAYKDYLLCMEDLHDVVDYFTINISSPNTVGLRNLQSKEPLQKLLGAVQNRNQSLSKPRPIFVKIAPDLDLADLEDIVHVADEACLAGIVATNTTLSRKGLKEAPEKVDRLGTGGLSGAPLTKQSQYICEALSQLMPKHMALIASGGVMTGSDAADRIEAGASLVQVYSGFIYQGPSLVIDAINETANAALRKTQKPL